MVEGTDLLVQIFDVVKCHLSFGAGSSRSLLAIISAVAEISGIIFEVERLVGDQYLFLVGLSLLWLGLSLD